jgi:hypothetical protein
MPTDEPNDRTPSTTWAWKRVKVRRPAGGQKRGASGGHSSLRHRANLNPREPLTLKVTYRGGNECWWQIETRGVTIRRPGYLALHDVLWEIVHPQDH